jgi:ABC-type lipopolysaccharide export system ATPase subunit
VYVLSNGRLIARGAPVEVTNNPVVIEAYLGSGTARRMREMAGAPGA